VCRDLVEYFSRHSDFLRAAHLLGDREVYERHLSVIRHASERISALLIGKAAVAGEARDRLAHRLDLATRSVFALLQQRVTFGDYPPGEYAPRNEDEEAAELAELYRLCRYDGT